jgi:multidrug efflux pump subunit AcrA (membrane-fusion protein)
VTPMSQLESGGVFPLPDELRVYRSGAVAVPLAASTGTAARRLRVLLGRWRGPLKTALWVVVLFVALVVLRSTVLADKPLSVDVARVTRGAVEQTVSNTRAGTVKARQRARLSPETGGRVVALPFRKGARVARGDLLLSLDASRQRARLELAAEEVGVAAARAETRARCGIGAIVSVPVPGSAPTPHDAERHSTHPRRQLMTRDDIP